MKTILFFLKGAATMRFVAGTAGIFFFSALPASAAFTIEIDGLAGTEYRQYFDRAVSYWESVITGYQYALGVGAPGDVVDGSGNLAGIRISAEVLVLDPQTLGQAGPDAGAFYNPANLLYTTQGSMRFNSDFYTPASVVGGTNTGFYYTVLHEMAHVIGFGTLWNYTGTHNMVVDSGNASNYTGANALAVYRTQFNQPNATFIPLEQGGGAGTAGLHWDELDGGNGLSTISTTDGENLREELMTGWSSPNEAETFVSEMTKQSFADIGYLIAVPEPATFGIVVGLAVAGVWLAARRRRKVDAEA